MSYTSFADMANDIRRNAWKVPADVDIIVGVPRSGLLAALMLGEVLNKPVIDLDGFVTGREPQAGSRGKLMRHDKRCALILDDTVYSGASMKRAREKAQMAAGFAKMYFGCVYAEGRDAKWALLFVESDRKQAQEIARLAGKQVFCYEDGKMY